MSTTYATAAKLLALLVATSWCMHAQDTNKLDLSSAHVRVGQKRTEIHSLLGTPTSTVTLRKYYTTERWVITPHDVISVWFFKDKVKLVNRSDPNPLSAGVANSSSDSLVTRERSGAQSGDYGGEFGPASAPEKPVNALEQPAHLAELFTLMDKAQYDSIQLAIMHARGYDVAPVMTYKVAVGYTQEALQAGLEGTVVLSFTVGTNGIPTDIAIQQSVGGGLEEAAITALSRFRFKPAYKDGQPVAATDNVLHWDFRIPPPTPAPTQSKGARILDRVADAVGQLSLGQICPSLYRKPMVYMSANDMQWLQACNTNGYMFFGLYVYTGPR